MADNDGQQWLVPAMNGDYDGRKTTMDDNDNCDTQDLRRISTLMDGDYNERQLQQMTLAMNGNSDE
jgi:hypothetical protein